VRGVQWLSDWWRHSTSKLACIQSWWDICVQHNPRQQAASSAAGRVAGGGVRRARRAAAVCRCHPPGPSFRVGSSWAIIAKSSLPCGQGTGLGRQRLVCGTMAQHAALGRAGRDALHCTALLRSTALRRHAHMLCKPVGCRPAPLVSCAAGHVAAGNAVQACSSRQHPCSMVIRGVQRAALTAW
jgi:hypothetical protein